MSLLSAVQQHCDWGRSLCLPASCSLPVPGSCWQGNADGFGGEFVVPSYRGATFLDPKGRGAATGYDTAVALPAAGDDGELCVGRCSSCDAS